MRSFDIAQGHLSSMMTFDRFKILIMTLTLISNTEVFAWEISDLQIFQITLILATCYLGIFAGFIASYPVFGQYVPEYSCAEGSYNESDWSNLGNQSALNATEKADICDLSCNIEFDNSTMRNTIGKV